MSEASTPSRSPWSCWPSTSTGRPGLAGDRCPDRPASGGVLLRETELISRVRISFLSIILVAAAVIVGPVGAGIVGAVAMLAKVTSGPKVATAFNVAMMSGLRCGRWPGLPRQSAAATSSRPTCPPATVLLRVGLPLIVADVPSACSTPCSRGRVRSPPAAPVRTQVLKLLTTSGAAYVGYGVIGFLFVVLWIPAGVGWFSAVLVLAPLFVARWAFVQYGDELRAHERTLRALVPPSRPRTRTTRAQRAHRPAEPSGSPRRSAWATRRSRTSAPRRCSTTSARSACPAGSCAPGSS